MQTQALLTCAFGWCGRMPDSASCPKSCQSTGEVASQAPSCSHSPSDGAGGCSFAALLACVIVLLVTKQEPHPTMMMQGENLLFTEHQSSPDLQQWCQGRRHVAAHRGCPGAVRADLSRQPGPEVDASKDSTSACCDQTPLSPPWSLSPKRSPCAAAPPPFSRGPPWRPGARHSAHSGGSKGGRRALVTGWGSLENPLF